MSQEQEAWKAVTGWEGRYEISSWGRLRSFYYRGMPRKSPCILAAKHDSRGYQMARLCRDSKVTPKLVHRLVLETFVGPCPEGMECGHLDGNPYHNDLKNLVWITKKENMRHRDDHGRASRGENRPLSVFKEDEVRLLKQLQCLGYKRNDLVNLAVKKTGCDPTVARDILGGRTWKHVQ